MPTTFSSQIRTVADVVQTVMKCSKQEANEYEREICSKPENVAKLAAACGVSKLAIGYGGYLIVGGLYSAGTTATPGLVLTAAGVAGVRRFCSALVVRGLDGIEQNP